MPKKKNKRRKNKRTDETTTTTTTTTTTNPPVLMEVEEGEEEPPASVKRQKQNEEDATLEPQDDDPVVERKSKNDEITTNNNNNNNNTPRNESKLNYDSAAAATAAASKNNHHEKTRDRDETRTLLFHHLVRFVSNEKPSNNSDSNKSSEESIRFLLAHLQKETTPKTTTLSSREDEGWNAFEGELAELLLSWAVRQLVYHSNNPQVSLLILPYRVLDVSLRAAGNIFIQQRASLVSMLPLGTLIKIVPPMVLIAATSPDPQDTTTPANIEPDHETIQACCHRIYTALLSLGLFTPTLEVAVTSILIPMVEQLNNDNSNNNNQEDLVVATVEWIHSTLLTRGNPKTNFALLVRPKVISALSQLYHYSCSLSQQPRRRHQAIQRLVSDGLMSADHHLDGLIPLLIQNKKRKEKEHNKTSSSFRCYQEELLPLLRHPCRPGNAEDSTRIRFLPVLYEAFVEQVNLWNESNKSSSSIASEATFELFVQMTDPLMKKKQQKQGKDVKNAMDEEEEEEKAGDEKDTAIPVVVVVALELLTKLLLDHNIYIASQDDSVQSQYHFLERWACELLARMQTTTGDGDTGEDDFAILSKSFIRTMQHLLQLNHSLFPEKRLVHTLALVCRWGGDAAAAMSPTKDPNDDDPSLTSPAVAQCFLVCIMDTYQRLRQQKQLVQALLNFLSLSSSSAASIANANRLVLHRPAVTLALAKAIHASPPIQVKDVFLALQSWFRSHAVGDDTTATTLAVDLAVIVFQSVRVEATTASATADLVQSFTQTVIVELLIPNRAMLPAAMKLCAWLIRLQDKCAFWLGRHRQLKLPDALEQEVQQVVRQYSGTTGTQDSMITDDDSSHPMIDEALLLLASHRLQQIVSLLHDAQLALIHAQPSNDHGEYDDDSPLELEGKELAALLIMAADQEFSSATMMNRRGWIYIAQCVHIWVLYATDEAIDRFLRWLFTTLAQPTSSSSADKNDEERHVAWTLVQDVSFLDLIRIGTKLHGVALDRSCEWIVDKSIQPQSQGSQECWKRFCAALNNPDSLTSKTLLDEDLLRVLSAVDWKDIKTAATAKDPGLDSVIHSLVFVNQLPPGLLNASDVRGFFRRVVMAEWAVVSMEGFAGDGDALLSWASGLRNALEQSLSSILLLSAKDDQGMEVIGGFDTLLMYTQHLVDSTSRLMSSESQSQEVTAGSPWSAFLASTERLLSKCIYQLFHAATSDATERKQRLSQIVKLVPPEKDGSMPGILCTIKCVLHAAELARKNDILPSATETLSEFWRACWESWNECMSGHSAAALASSITNLGHLIHGDLLLRMKQWDISDWEKLVQRMEELIRSDLKQTDCNLRTAHYNLACLVRARPMYSQIDLILDELLSASREDSMKRNKLLEATFCELVQHLDQKDCGETIGRILSPSKKLLVAVRLRLITLILDAVKLNAPTAVLTEVLCKRGQDMFYLSQQQLCSCSVDGGSVVLWEKHVVDSLSLLRALIRHKEIFSLQEHDLAIVLSSLNAVIGGSLRHGRNVSSQVFVGCAKTLLLLLQRRAKRLYECVPSVISVFYSLFQSFMCLHDGLLSEANIKIQSNELSRLCEALVAHREVYKKHVVGLVLEFVHTQALKNDVVIKNAMLPSIHCLLDMLSVHETEQLNALMKVQAKPMFGSIYKTYRKLYAYKGQ